MRTAGGLIPFLTGNLSLKRGNRVMLALKYVVLGLVSAAVV